MTRTKAIAAAVLLLATACSNPDDLLLPPDDEVIALTQAQAAALVASVESFGESDPSLAALSDTVDVVIKAGAVARRIDVTTDLGDGPFWAVALHMPSTTSSPASSTFHVIAFDNPDSPSQFIILGGWAQGTGSTAPNTVIGSLSGPSATTSVTAHLFSVSESAVSVWHATAGTSALASNANGTACSGFSGPGTCVPATMDVSFAITGSVADAGSAATGERTASATVTLIPGIRISP